MRFTRLILIGLCLVLSVAALGPAVALASGPSAGDQQYVDPLGGSTGSGNSGSGSSSSSSGSSSSGSGTVASSPSTATASAGSTTTPATTTATGTASTTSGTTTSSTRTLPFTGFNVWEGAVIGVVMLGAGALLRRRAAQE